MLRCQELVELVTDWLEGVLDPDADRKVRTHLDECVECLVFLGHTTTTIALLHSLGPQGVAARSSEPRSTAASDGLHGCDGIVTRGPPRWVVAEEQSDGDGEQEGHDKR